MSCVLALGPGAGLRMEYVGATFEYNECPIRRFDNVVRSTRSAKKEQVCPARRSERSGNGEQRRKKRDEAKASR